MRFGGSARVVPQSVIELLGQLEELDCSSKSSSGQVGTGMMFPPASVWNGGLPGVRAFFSGDAVDIELKGAGIRVEDVDDLARGLEKVAVRSMDLSENGALGTAGVGRLVSSCAGELIACVIWFCAFSCLCVTLVCRELATCAVWRQREGCAPECD